MAVPKARLPRHRTATPWVRVAIRKHRQGCLSHYWMRIQTVLWFCPSSTMMFGRCTRTKWPASGPLMRSTSRLTCKTGRNSVKTSNTSLRMSWPFSLPVTALFSKTLLSDSWLKFRFLKQEHSTVSRWWWKTSTLRCILSWSTHTWKTQPKKNTCLEESKLFQLSRKKLTGHSSGSSPMTVLLSDW